MPRTALSSRSTDLPMPPGRMPFPPKRYHTSRLCIKSAWCVSLWQIGGLVAGLIVRQRFYTVSAVGLPHETMKDVQFGNMRIPNATTVYFNNEAINHGRCCQSLCQVLASDD
jgi:hypothetical protein